MSGDSLTVVLAGAHIPGTGEVSYALFFRKGSFPRRPVPQGITARRGESQAVALLLTCVFLAAAGYRNGASVNNVGSNGNYWSSSVNNENNAYNVNFNSGNLNPQNNNNRYNGFSVRLVRHPLSSPVCGPGPCCIAA